MKRFNRRDKRPSSAQMVPTPSTTPPETMINSSTPSGPPGYFDIVPDSRVFFPARYPTPGPKPSTAKSSEKKKGVYSHDPILDENPAELWRYLVSNLREPHLAVHLSGTHTETRHGGHGRSHTVTVTDFSFQFDVSQYVIPQWSRIVASPRKASKVIGAPMPTVRETLEEYTSSKNLFKEFRLEKLVLWDIDRVTQLLTDLVRSTGYRTDIGVKFPRQDYKVVAVASNGYSRAAHNRVVRVLCVVSCLCIVFWPAWEIARKRLKNRLACEYGMAVSADDFFSRNWERIHSAVVRRCERVFMVAL